MRVFTTTIIVRGYELDGYGHVNNAVYLNYAEWARWCMIKEAAGSMDYFKAAGLAPVVARVEVDYKRPCLLGEELIIETRLTECKRKIAIFQHQIIKPNAVLAAEVRATLVGVGPEGRAVELPADFSTLFSD